MTDYTPWTFLSGLVDADPKLTAEIKKNPKAAYTLIKPLLKKFPTQNTNTFKELIAYICGYVGTDYDLVKKHI